MSIEQRGKVITFYSYKGGTGRTMTLANVACLLAQGQLRALAKRVLMIDWDLEAPGLHRFFRDKFANEFNDVDNPDLALDKQPGLIDLFSELDKKVSSLVAPDKEQDEDAALELVDNIDLEHFILKTDIPNLYLLKAGRFDDNYATLVNSFQWEHLYNRSPSLISAFAERLAREYRYVLIDSRTGLSDTGSICTMLMPERLVVVFTPNRQSLTGLSRLIRQATNYRRNSSDERPLVVFPLASRIDMSESKLHEIWRYGGNSDQQITGYQTQFEELFKELYDLEECVLEGYFNEVQIQHVSRYAYGEEIAVLIERGGERLSLSRSYESFTERLVKLVGPWQEPALAIARDFDVYMIHSVEDAPMVQYIAHKLRQRHLKLWLAEEQIPPGRPFVNMVEQVTSSAKKVALFIGSNGLGDWQLVEIQSFIHQRVEAGVSIIPVLLPGVNDIPEDLLFLKELNWIKFDRLNDVEALDQLEWGITGKHPRDNISSEGRMGRKGWEDLRRREPAHKLDAIFRELVTHLLEIPGIERPEVRGNLHILGFTRTEISLIMRGRRYDLYTDLIAIIKLAQDLLKLDVLIDNAVSLTQKKEHRKELEEIKRKYLALEAAKRVTFPLIDDN